MISQSGDFGKCLDDEGGTSVSGISPLTKMVSESFLASFSI
jgi:hypothetical protein